MDPINALEKVINEHGSAPILKERLALVQDQLQRLKETNAALEKENKQLRDENKNLKQAVAAFSPPGSTALNGEQKKILLTLGEQEEWLTAEDLSQHLQINITKVKYYLGQFEEKVWVSGSHFYTGQSSEYKIADEGRGYLIRSGMIA